MLKECFLCEVLNKLVAEEIEAFHTANIQASICVWSWDTAVGLSSLEKTQVVMPKCRCRLSSVKAASRKSGREQEEMTARRAGVSRWESTPSDAPSAVTSWCLGVCQLWGRNEGKQGVEIGSGQYFSPKPACVGAPSDFLVLSPFLPPTPHHRHPHGPHWQRGFTSLQDVFGLALCSAAQGACETLLFVGSHMHWQMQRSPFAVHLGSQTNWNSTLRKLSWPYFTCSSSVPRTENLHEH